MSELAKRYYRKTRLQALKDVTDRIEQSRQEVLDRLQLRNDDIIDWVSDGSLTVQDICSATGLSVSQVKRILKGKRTGYVS